MNLEQKEICEAFPSTRRGNTPSIYVACLAAYNEGFLHGCWIDCTIGEDYVREAIKDMLSASPADHAEEYAIHDYENFSSHKVGEWSDISELCQIAELLDEENGEIILELSDHLGCDIEKAKEYFEDNSIGIYDSLADYAEQFYEDTSTIPEQLKYYIDWERVGEDMEMNGDLFSIQGDDGYYLFYNS